MAYLTQMIRVNRVKTKSALPVSVTPAFAEILALCRQYDVGKGCTEIKKRQRCPMDCLTGYGKPVSQAFPLGLI
jgi:hypothetical protein